MSSSSFNRDEKLVNDNLETPIHVAIKPHVQKEVSLKVLNELLQLNLVNPLIEDKSGKKAIDLLKTSDPRAKMLKKYMSKWGIQNNTELKKKTEVMNVKTKEEPDITVSTYYMTEGVNQRIPETGKNIDYHQEQELVIGKVKSHIERIMNETHSYFVDETTGIMKRSMSNSLNPTERARVLKEGNNNSLCNNLQTSETSDNPNLIVSSLTKSITPCQLEFKLSSGVSSLDNDQELSDLMEWYSNENGLRKLDELPWEVEVSSTVINYFKNTKKFTLTDRLNAMRVIYSLAEGLRNYDIAKQVSSDPIARLYEGRISASGRILWEKAISYSYSARTTDQSDCDTYTFTQVIRVWEIILDHDNLNSKIKHCIKKIKELLKDSRNAMVQWKLQPIGVANKDNTHIRGQQKNEYPCLYHLSPNQGSCGASEHQCCPVVSSSLEYHIKTFHSFDAMTALSILGSLNERRDYPIKVSSEERAIIKKDSSEPLLVLGRSGTGKTTCCLYRLWNEFINYWDPSSKTYGCKIQRKVHYVAGNITVQHQTKMSEGNTTKTEPIIEDFIANESGDVEEDLHQLFVTKNYLLCNQMKKSFYSMVAAFDFLNSHLNYEDTVPNSLEKFDDLHFPIFLTAKQFYILLDNSLEGNKFFDRDHDGNLQNKVIGMDYDHEHHDYIWEESDSEDDDIDDEVLYSTSNHLLQLQYSGKVWTEDTGLYFKERIWPKIT